MVEMVLSGEEGVGIGAQLSAK